MNLSEDSQMFQQEKAVGSTGLKICTEGLEENQF